MAELLIQIQIYSKSRYYGRERMVNKIHSSHLVKPKTIPSFIKSLQPEAL